MSVKSYIPNLLTIANLCLGCGAIVFTLDGNIHLVPFLIFTASLADFMDGFLARKLKVSSSIGLQLDSLADMVTFGVVPAMVVFQLLHMGYGNFYPDLGAAYFWWKAPAFMLAAFSAWRLAKFNVDDRQDDKFIGLATPACTIFIVSLILIVKKNQYPWSLYAMHPMVLYAITLVFSYLLVAEIPMFALKFKHFGWRGNELRFGFMLAALLSLLLVGYLAIPFLMLLYIALSVVHYRFWERA